MVSGGESRGDRFSFKEWIDRNDIGVAGQVWRQSRVLVTDDR